MLKLIFNKDDLFFKKIASSLGQIHGHMTLIICANDNANDSNITIKINPYFYLLILRHQNPVHLIIECM